MLRLYSLKTAVFAFITLALAAGCTQFNISKPNVWPFTGDDPPGTPTKIVASWTDTVFYQPNQVPMRGFGGRLMFYEGDKPEPIKVDGTLSVYVFDETNRDPNNVKPDRKCVFTKEQIPSHYSKSKLGHSYSVWIPWDEVGGPQKEISLIVRFTPEKGGVVVSEQTKQLLPGQPQQEMAKKTGGGAPATAQATLNGQHAAAQNAQVQATSYVMPLPPVSSGIQNRGQNAADHPQNNNFNGNIDVATIQLSPQSSLKKAMQTANGENLETSKSMQDLPPVNPKYVTRTGVINPAGQLTEDNPQAQRPEIAAAYTGTTPSNQFAQAQPVLQPNRFAPGPLQVPNVQPGQPCRAPVGWQQPPLRPASFPQTLPQGAVSSGPPQTPPADNWTTQQN
jgi:hypothetical protein